ncbi:hypothetical protein EAG18_00720 [Pseudoalteromonas sp. J010]|uniref:hypothetical protein n=1 Tax=Pseudoalteromonas sp. J010 TaxID=998465 RepID=UPI000F64FDB5|nr:hypothetical protein [Pseudoalteromonas sp. J010]RRS10582.1 hypothetical protein EAG18_00720 [Pseudoalteromonas sp. J010]
MSKKLGLAGVGIALGACIVTAVANWLAPAQVSFNDPVRVPPLHTLNYSKFDEERLHALLPILDKQIVIAENDKALSLGMLGYVARDANFDLQSVINQHSLSMVYKSADKMYAVVDNQVYELGQTLPSGAKLVDVQDRTAVFYQQGQMARLSMTGEAL